MINQQRSVFGLSIVTVFVAMLFAVNVPSACAQSEEEFAKQRKTMVEYAVRRAGVKDARVLKAMNATPRHQFVPKPIRGSTPACRSENRKRFRRRLSWLL